MKPGSLSAKLHALTGEEHASLARFAQNIGRRWKCELAKAWERGALGISPVLMRLKVTLGPTGLHRYRLWMAAWAPLPEVTDVLVLDAEAVDVFKEQVLLVLADYQGTRNDSHGFSRHEGVRLEVAKRVIDNLRIVAKRAAAGGG